jgi:ubiquinone biosynthesis protein
MVVVEGVARGLDPNINIWQVAGPVVQDYISRNVGPLALARDLARTAQVLARFGPKLPRLMEDLLIRQAELPQPLPSRPVLPILWVLLGAAAALATGFWLGQVV